MAWQQQPGNRMIDRNRFKSLLHRIFGSKWVTRVILATVLVIILSFALVETLRQWFLAYDTAVNTVGTLLLTAGLVYLYNQQRKLLALNQEPLLEPLRYSPNDEKLEMELSNVGEGVAKDLELVTLARFPPSKWHGATIESGLAETDLHRKDADPGLGRSIQPGEKAVTFEAEPVSAVKDGPDRMNRLYLDKVISRLRRSEAETASFHFYIRYTDPLENKGIEDILHIELDLVQTLEKGDVLFSELMFESENLAERPDHEVVLPTVWPDLSYDLRSDELRKW